jgi:hypothetical protein
MSKILRVWLDDQRLPPPGYNVWFQCRVEALPEFVKENAEWIEAISFDNSLGYGAGMEGHNLLNTIESMVCADGLRLPKLKELFVHTGDSNQVMPMIYACQHIAERHEGVSVYRSDYEWDCDRMREDNWNDYMAWRDRKFPGPVM